MLIVPIIVPTEKNKPNFSNPLRFQCWQYQIKPKRVVKIKGPQLRTKSWYQTSELYSGSRFAFSKCSNKKVPKNENIIQDVKMMRNKTQLPQMAAIQIRAINARGK